MRPFWRSRKQETYLVIQSAFSNSANVTLQTAKRKDSRSLGFEMFGTRKKSGGKVVVDKTDFDGRLSTLYFHDFFFDF